MRHRWFDSSLARTFHLTTTVVEEAGLKMSIGQHVEGAQLRISNCTATTRNTKIGLQLIHQYVSVCGVNNSVTVISRK